MKRDAERVSVSMPVRLGARWTPDYVVRVDTEMGTFEAVNPPPCEHVQAALIGPGIRERRDWHGLIAFGVIVVVCISYFIWKLV